MRHSALLYRDKVADKVPKDGIWRRGMQEALQRISVSPMHDLLSHWLAWCFLAVGADDGNRDQKIYYGVCSRLSEVLLAEFEDPEESRQIRAAMSHVQNLLGGRAISSSKPNETMLTAADRVKNLRRVWLANFLDEPLGYSMLPDTNIEQTIDDVLVSKLNNISLKEESIRSFLDRLEQEKAKQGHKEIVDNNMGPAMSAFDAAAPEARRGPQSGPQGKRAAKRALKATDTATPEAMRDREAALEAKRAARWERRARKMRYQNGTIAGTVGDDAPHSRHNVASRPYPRAWPRRNAGYRNLTWKREQQDKQGFRHNEHGLTEDLDTIAMQGLKISLKHGGDEMVPG